MIASVCLNPGIDRTVELTEFTIGGMNRAQAVHVNVGGKGVNVALAAAELSAAVCIAGFFGVDDRPFFEECFLKADVAYMGIWVPGKTRQNSKLIDCKSGVCTEINERGLPVTQEQLFDMFGLIESLAAQCDYVVLTGSLPPGCPQTYYRDIAKSSAAPFILDTHGEPFRLALDAHPHLIKPNADELKELIGFVPRGINETAKEAAKLCKTARYAAISMGSAGAVLADGEHVFHAPGLQVQARSTVGAGDCMVAGMLYGLSRYPGDSAAILRCGVAAGTAGVMTEGTGLLRRDDFEALLDRVEVKRL